MYLENFAKTFADVRRQHEELSDIVKKIPGGELSVRISYDGMVRFYPQMTDNELIEIISKSLNIDETFKCKVHLPSQAISLLESLEGKSLRNRNLITGTGLNIDAGSTYMNETSRCYVFASIDLEKMYTYAITHHALAKELAEIGLEMEVGKECVSIVTKKKKCIAEVKAYTFTIYKTSYSKHLADLLYNHITGVSVYKSTQTSVPVQRTIEHFGTDSLNPSYELNIFPEDGSAFRFFDLE
jgi:hypothetical protein